MGLFIIIYDLFQKIVCESLELLQLILMQLDTIYL